jgi:alpha-glucosidase
VNPYNWQDHLYDKNQPENLEFLRRLRALMDEYPAATAVGEVGDGQYGLQIQAEYTSGGDKVHMCYSFEFLSGIVPTAERVGEVVTDYEEAIGDGWACWAFSNHDVMRHASRWNLGEDARRLYAGLLLCLRGSVCLYQGEELGLTEAYVAYEDLQDPYGIRFWPELQGPRRLPHADPVDFRQPERRLFRRQAVAAHGGGAPAPRRRQPGGQGGQHARLLPRDDRLPQRLPRACQGQLHAVQANGGILSFIREHEGLKLFCAFNMTNTALPVALPKGEWRQDLGAPFTAMQRETEVTLPPYQAYFGAQEAA